MRPILRFFLFLLLPVSLYAQAPFIDHIDFVKSRGPHIQATLDGGWITVNSYFDEAIDINYPIGILIIKYNDCGNIAWSKSYQTPNTFLEVTGFIIHSSRQLIISGYFIEDDSNLKRDLFVLRLFPDGERIFFKRYQRDRDTYPYTLDETSNGDLMIFGNIALGPIHRNFFMLLNEEGAITWTRGYFNNGIWGRGLACSDGGFLGRTSSLIYKINAAGELLWANWYSRVSYSSYFIEIDGGYAAAFYNSGSQNTPHFVYKLDLDGNIEWVSPGMTNYGIPSLQVLPNNHILCLDTANPDGDNPSFVLTEFSNEGQIISQKAIVNNDISGGQNNIKFTILEDGSLAFAATSDVDQLMIGKTDPQFELGCEALYFDNTDTIPSINIFPKDSDVTEPTFESSDIPIMITDEFHSPTRSCEEEIIFPELRSDTTLCMGASILLSAFFEGANYRWQDGSTNPEFLATTSGTYILEIEKCGVSHTTEVNIDFIDCPCTVLNPTAFTPDGDGLNDYFQIINDCPINQFQLQIYNRFGQLVFQSNDPENVWGGIYKGQPAPMDVYLYRYVYQIVENGVLQEHVEQGDLTLIR